MQKLRRLNFFDKHVVKQEGSDVHPGIQKLSISCACGAPDHLWLGSRDGELHRLDQQFALQPPVRIFDRDLTDITVVLEGQRLVALGCDAVASGATKYKIFDLRREGGIAAGNAATSAGLAAPLVTNRVFPQRAQEVRASCLAANSALTLVAIGVDSGVVYLFRGSDLGQDRPYPTVLGTEGDPPITSVHFLEHANRTVLYVCSTESVCSWSVLVGKDFEQKQLSVDTAGGPEPHCSCVLPLINALLVARGDAIFAYDPDQGNMSAMQLDGDKLHMSQFKSYFISVTAEGGLGSLGGVTAPSPSSMPKQTITVCLAYPHMRFIAYSNQFTDVTHVVVGMGSVFVISRGGADSNTVLFELREKDLTEQLDILVKKRMFEWAAETALRGGAAPSAAAEIYRQHGDALFEKRAYDQALAVYTKTVDLGLPLEPSYVVERYLDAQRIGHVAKYLKRLHEANLAEREHTALLLKCYTKLKDFSTLGSFLETTPVSQYDPATAIEVLESAGYYGLAAEIAQKVDRQEDYVRISLEHFKSYTKTTEFIGTLPKARASRILAEHGRVLMRNAPRDTVNLVRGICGLRGDGVPKTEGPLPRLDELLPMFVDSQPQLELFLRSLLLAPGGCTLPPSEAESLYPTLLELMVRSHAALLRDAQLAAGATSTTQPGTAPQSSHDSEQQARRLSGEIMRLIRQYPSEAALASALMLCQTYGFTDGFFHAAERLGRYQLLMTWCFEQRDARRLLDVCKRCGSADQSLWVQALSFLAEDEGNHMEEISEVLKHVEESDLMPLLMVIETLQKNPSIKVGDTRAYLQGQFGRLVESVETSRGKARQDRQEIMRMQQEITSLRTQAQVFSSTRCAQCGLSLEVPAVHFFCGHSYHSYCVQSDGGCPKCSAEALPKTSLKEKREAQARNPEEFFKYLHGGGGEVGLQAIGEWCKFGAFDAGTPAATRAVDGP
mmetsp:Transcript_68179/g.134654  ORF Transcript_68179/g.134654 Transcript_68179/m.134654 type:complete len:952 (-) Transcript_68179:67-2922(-)